MRIDSSTIVSCVIISVLHLKLVPHYMHTLSSLIMLVLTYTTNTLTMVLAGSMPFPGGVVPEDMHTCIVVIWKHFAVFGTIVKSMQQGKTYFVQVPIYIALSWVMRLCPASWSIRSEQFEASACWNGKRQLEIKVHG